jgi:uncharacterized secreted repeat protein (TIGR03808 family)
MLRRSDEMEAVPMLNRRRFLAGTAGFAVGGLTVPLSAAAASRAGVELASMRGSIDATELGVRPGAFDDQSKAFAKMVQSAAERDMPVFLPPGTYVVSNLALPRRVRLAGVPSATRIVYGGDGHLFAAEDAEIIDLSGLVLDGANKWLGDYTQGLVDLRRVSQLAIDNCQIIASGKNGISLEAASGRIERSTISGAADAGIYSVEAGRMQISGNTVTDCGNGGILVHRWQPAEDGTMVTGNRVERIAARNGGTGQYGNGINAFRAGNVMIANNMVSDCAFSAIRANSSNNVQIAGNTCSRLGETAIYSEFSFEGAVITGNIVDGAANGISIVNFNEGGRLGVCSNNIVRNMSKQGPYPPDAAGFGIGIGIEADTAVTGNVVENAPSFGINIGWGPYLRNVTATGNVVRNAGTGIAVTVVEGAGSAVITDNIIDGAKNGAIVGHRWLDAATGDLASGGNGGFAHLTIERNHAS